MGLQSILASFAAGSLVAISWTILIDGIIASNRDGGPAFMWFWALPAIFATVTAVLMNLVTSAQLSSSGGIFDDSSSTKVRVWFFLTLTGSLLCLGGALWILIENYTGKAAAWPGVALLLQTIIVTAAGLVFFFARGGRSEYAGL